ncbi:MAG: HAD-IIIA family hydrolase, partial [Croceibacterium sp.]
RLGLNLSVSIEPAAAGTGGALRHAGDMLADRFILLNGDTWLEINYHALLAQLDATGAVAALGLRPVDRPDRYDTAVLDDGLIRDFGRERPTSSLALINGGVAACTRALFDLLPDTGSIEALVWPKLAREGRLAGLVTDGFFLDIGVPEAFERAQQAIPARHRRGAVFFDRDGVLNIDRGYVGSIDRFEWLDGAREAVKLVNESGRYAFVVTNQAGVAKGHYGEADVQALHAHMQRELNAAGAHIDDFRYCPYHLAGSVAEYARHSDCRKPEPGMLVELMRDWPVDVGDSVMIGDKASDMAAARAAGVRGALFSGGPLKAFVRSQVLPKKETQCRR